MGGYPPGRLWWNTLGRGSSSPIQWVPANSSSNSSSNKVRRVGMQGRGVEVMVREVGMGIGEVRMVVMVGEVPMGERKIV